MEALPTRTEINGSIQRLLRFQANTSSATPDVTSCAGPSFGAADWSLAKSFQFTERARLQLRWEMFNAFNQTNLANPTTGIDSSLAGRITGLAHFMRRQQLGAHVYW